MRREFNIFEASPLPFGLSPIAQTNAISLSNCASFTRGDVSTHRFAAAAARSSVFAIISRKILARQNENVKRNKSLFDRKKRIRQEFFFQSPFGALVIHSAFAVSLSFAMVEMSIFFISMHFSRIILSE